MRADSKLKIMGLQLRAWRDRLYITIPGRFAQKRRTASEAVSRVIIQQTNDAVKSFYWRPVPRARVAVEIQFFAASGDVPDIHHLVKFYLDHLRGVVFIDDKQVASLIAISWKPPPRSNGFGGQNRVHIAVERFSDCVRRFDLWQTLCQDDRFRRDHRFRRVVDDEDDDADRFHLRADDGLFERVKMSEEAREGQRRLQVINHQNDLLALNRIDYWDTPICSAIRRSLSTAASRGIAFTSGTATRIRSANAVGAVPGVAWIST